MAGQNLTVFSFLRAKEDSYHYKRALEETKVIFDEQIVGESSKHRTKMSLDLYSNGEQSTHDDLLAAIANMDCILTFMTSDEASSSTLILDIRKYFVLLADPQFREWFTFHIDANVTWLVHSFLIDIHNVVSQRVEFAQNPDNMRKALAGEEIPATVLDDYRLNYKAIVHKWRVTLQNQSLGAYISEPRTWIVRNAKLNPPPAQHPNKQQKKDDRSPPTDDNGKNKKEFGKFEKDKKGSNPKFGFLEAAAGFTFGTGPRLSGNRRPCANYIIKGKSCPHGRNCRFEHMSAPKDNTADHAAFSQWISATDGIDWGYTTNRTNNTSNATTSPPRGTGNNSGFPGRGHQWLVNHC